jgi:glutathione S-transferase
VLPIFGQLSFDAEKYRRATKDTQALLQILDNHLKTRQFLSGKALSYADITVASCLVNLF